MSDDVKVGERPAACVCNVRPEGNTKLHDCDSEMIRKTFEVLLRTRKTWRARNDVEAAIGGKTRMSHVLNLIVCHTFKAISEAMDLFISVPTLHHDQFPAVQKKRRNEHRELEHPEVMHSANSCSLQMINEHLNAAKTVLISVPVNAEQSLAVNSWSAELWEIYQLHSSSRTETAVCQRCMAQSVSSVAFSFEVEGSTPAENTILSLQPQHLDVSASGSMNAASTCLVGNVTSLKHPIEVGFMIIHTAHLM